MEVAKGHSFPQKEQSARVWLTVIDVASQR